MRKIHVTRQFFEASGRHGDFFERPKNPFSDKVNGSMCAKFLVCIVFLWPGGVTQIHKYTHIQVKLGISSAGCSPPVDFDIHYSTGIMNFSIHCY